MRKTYNLLDEKWIQVENKEYLIETISLMQLADNPDKYTSLAFTFPGHNLAVLRFLISLIYIHRHPKDIDEWFEMYKGNPFEPVNEFASKLRPYLDLLDKDNPFMQINADNFETQVNKIMPHFPAASGTIFFNHDTDNIQIGIDILPVLLLSALCFVPKQGGAGYKKGINGIPLFITINSNNLKQSIMLNLIYEEFLSNDNAIKHNCSVSDLLPFDEEKVAPQKISLAAGYNWRSRNIGIEYKSGTSICSLTGNKTDTYVENVYYKPGPEVTDYWCDPMVAPKETQNSNTGAISKYNTEADEFIPSWKGYTSILMARPNNKLSRKRPLILQQYDEILMNDSSMMQSKVNLTLFGFLYKSGGKAYTGIIEDEMYYSETIAQSKELVDTVDNVISKTGALANSLKWALKGLSRDAKNSLGLIFNEGEEYQFWKGLENDFKQFIIDLSDEGIKGSQKLEMQWYSEAIKYTWKEFNRLSSGICQSASSFKKLAEAKQKLTTKINKDFEQYFKWLSNEKEVKAK